MSASASAKPDRASSDSDGARTLWQICWNEDQEEPVVTMVDIADIDLRTGSDFRPHATLDEETGDIIVFEKNASELEGKIRKGGSIYKKPYSRRTEDEGVDLSETSMVGWKFLVGPRSDSQLNLIPPGSGTTEWWARAAWCCLSCRTAQFWRQYWHIPVLVLSATSLYALVTVIILRALLDTP